MQPEVISDTIQEYRGRRYYKCGEYFQRDGERLHRRIAMDFFGAIPRDCHVHHVDGDKSNNDPDNLEVKPIFDHLSDHKRGHGQGIPKEALAAAAVWHGSGAGREWHKKHYDDFKHLLHATEEKTCAQCGSVYEGHARENARFCSNKCKTRSRYLSGVDDEDRACVECGTRLRINKYIKKTTCGRSCGGKVSARKRLGRG